MSSHSTLIVIPSEQELHYLYPSVTLEAVRDGSFPVTADCRLSLLGVGLVASGAALARQLSQKRYDAVILTGICGAYVPSGLRIGEIVRVDRELIGDLGIEGSDGSFVPWYRKFGGEPVLRGAPAEKSPHAVVSKFRGVTGVSVNCCSGTEKTATGRCQLFDADVESMEGASFFAVCQAFQVPGYEIRAVSNMVSVRDESLWNSERALAALKKEFLEAGGFL